MKPMLEQLSEEESLRLAAGAVVGRIGFTGRYGPVVLPVNFKMIDGVVVFRTDGKSSLDEDLRTGITDAEYRVAFEIDQIDETERTGWSVMIRGPRTTWRTRRNALPSRRASTRGPAATRTSTSASGRPSSPAGGSAEADRRFQREAGFLGHRVEVAPTGA